ncbi:hypothetical protein C0993_003142 [Termitomyces sp. T159_Od127]|nr:hypothetical protein C0993_003142 [Termitomyces sp. T159_Od127]
MSTINNFIVWTNAASNRHYLVALTSLMVLLSLLFQPLSAALLVVKDTYLPLPDVTLNTTSAIGLNHDLQYLDLTSFVTAAGFASASVLYNLPDPSFIHEQYTVAPFEVDMAKHDDGSGWNNSAKFNDCTISWSVDKSAVNLFGVNTTDCSQSNLAWFKPVVFWFFTYEPIANASATFCFPNISLWDVNVNVDLATGNLTKVLELRPFSSSSNFSSLSGNVTGDPLFGRAYNGVQFNVTNTTIAIDTTNAINITDPFVLDRQTATRIQLPAAVFQAAVQSPQGLIGSFESDKFVDLSTSVYQTYLALIARNVYFLPHNESLTVQVKTFQSRVWLSSIATHILAASMLVLALCAGIIHIFHRVERRRLRLRHEPGTIASAVSIGAQTGMGELLAGRHRQEEIKEVLSNKKFRIDPRTMKIIMEGEEGYESAASPMNRRRSVFAALQTQGMLGGRLSVWSNQRQPSLPNSPRRKDDV